MSNRTASTTIRSGTVNDLVTTASSLQSPLDSVSSAQIAHQVAQMTALPELVAVRNQADSETAQLAIAASDETIVAKPQIVNTSLKSKKDITFYTTKPSDTVTSIARSFGLTANSVRWSNGLSSEAVETGKKLVIPPANGVVHKVKSGDTVDSIIRKYQADKEIFVIVNDAETGRLEVGEYVWVPGGTVTVARAATFQPSASLGSFSGGTRYGSCGVNIPGVSGAYNCGYCTWWVAYRRKQIGNPVPGGLGNAYTWVIRARAMGLPTGNKPQAGAVIWFNSNHVGFVEKQNADGSWLISEMNYRGWDNVSNRTLTPAQAKVYGYIY